MLYCDVLNAVGLLVRSHDLHLHNSASFFGAASDSDRLKSEENQALCVQVPGLILLWVSLC